MRLYVSAYPNSKSIVIHFLNKFNEAAGPTHHQLWIDICQKARTDPHDLVDRNFGKFLKLILDSSSGTKVGHATLTVAS
jgi:hypothetical protein